MGLNWFKVVSLITQKHTRAKKIISHANRFTHTHYTFKHLEEEKKKKLWICSACGTYAITLMAFWTGLIFTAFPLFSNNSFLPHKPPLSFNVGQTHDVEERWRANKRLKRSVQSKEAWKKYAGQKSRPAEWTRQRLIKAGIFKVSFTVTERSRAEAVRGDPSGRHVRKEQEKLVRRGNDTLIRC